jgi:hypothetical protein
VAGAIIMRHTNSLAAEAPHQPADGPFPEELAAQALRWHNTSRPVAGRRSSSLPQGSHAMRILPFGVTSQSWWRESRDGSHGPVTWVRHRSSRTMNRPAENRRPLNRARLTLLLLFSLRALVPPIHPFPASNHRA